MAKVNLWLPPIDSANWQRFIVPITLFRILNQISLKASIFPLNISSFRNQYMPLCNIHTPKYMIDQIWLKVTSQDIQASVHKCTVHQNQSLQIFFSEEDSRNDIKFYKAILLLSLSHFIKIESAFPPLEPCFSTTYSTSVLSPDSSPPSWQGT